MRSPINVSNVTGIPLEPSIANRGRRQIVISNLSPPVDTSPRRPRLQRDVTKQRAAERKFSTRWNSSTFGRNGRMRQPDSLQKVAFVAPRMVFDDDSPCIASALMIAVHHHEGLSEPFKVVRETLRRACWQQLQQLHFAGLQKTAIARKDSVEPLRDPYCSAITYCSLRVFYVALQQLNRRCRTQRLT
jgi:hypothetical protein